MSDERYVNGNQTLELSRNWSVAGTYADAPSLKNRDLPSRALGFGRAFLFSPRVELMGETSVEPAGYKSCEVCGMNLHNSARFCSSCGIPVNRDQSYENSW